MRGVQERRAVAAVAADRGSAAAAAGGGRRLALGALVAAAVVAADQFTKHLALGGLDDGPIHVIWTLQLRLTFNRGAAFGLGPGISPVLVAVGVVVLVGLLAFGRDGARTPGAVVALGLIVGGALGNLVDRVVRDHGGAVVDFVDLQWWPVFNLADAAITCGAVALVLVSRR